MNEIATDFTSIVAELPEGPDAVERYMTLHGIDVDKAEAAFRQVSHDVVGIGGGRAVVLADVIRLGYLAGVRRGLHMAAAALEDQSS